MFGIIVEVFMPHSQGIDILLPPVWTWDVDILLSLVWIWGNSILATKVFVGISTAMSILVSSPQLIEEVGGGGYDIDIKCFFEFDCIDFIFTCSKY